MARAATAAELSAMEARFGLKVCSRLSGDLELPHDIGERLRVAREMAVARAAKRLEVKPAQAAADVILHADGSAVLRLGPDRTPWWLRLSVLAPLLVLVLGLLVIHEWSRHEQISAAADIDSALLGDTLPPQAYADPGFDEFLRDPDQPPVE